MKGGDIHETVRKTAILNDMVEVIQQLLGITFQEGDIAYDLLITHLHHAIVRSKHNNLHTMDKDILAMIKKKNAHSLQCPAKISQQLLESHNLHLPNEEL